MAHSPAVSGSAAQDGQGRGVEVVALVTSAGGLEAVSAVLRVLPRDFPAAVVLTQHLGGQGSALDRILARRIALPVRWAREGRRIEPGTVTVCPPRSVLEILPDRTCAVRRGESVTADRPLDALLTSVGDSFGAAALAVVLTGMGSDGVTGAAAVRAAGGHVIAQSQDTAEQPSMPAAAAAAGAVDLVLPLPEIGATLVDVVAGRPLPVPGYEAEAIQRTFGEDGEIARIAREIDWAGTPLGAVSTWPEAQRAVTQLAMASPYPVSLHLGAEYILLFNEAAIPSMAGEYERVFAVSSIESYPEGAGYLLPVLAQARAGNPVRHEGVKVPYVQGGRMFDAWFDGFYTAICAGDGTVLGVQQTYLNRTHEVLGRRRLQTLNRLAVAPAARSRHEALEAAVGVLSSAEDVPFAAAYLLNAPRSEASLVAVSGAEAGSAMAPHRLRLAPGAAWPLHRVVEETSEILLDDVAERFRGQRVTDERLSLEQALLHPLRDQGADGGIVGSVILGVLPAVPLDDGYRGFLTLVGETVGAKVHEAHARQRERDRLQRLADLDRAKTEFFSNVSHEFRTPLTLMLGPLEELGRNSDGLTTEQRADVDLVRRNARRLLRLVGTMLDFSQIEAGRLRATFAPVDLAERTRDIVAQFDSAAHRAGVRLEVDLAQLPEPVWVDVEMWEKIVSNLLSNALKFTFEGDITVTLRALPKHAELVVRDTGVGIPQDELPHVFKRFHRVRGTRARTHEGAGIGLALADELVRRHHGRVRVASTVGEGTTFTVWIPTGRRPESADAAPPTSAPLQVAAAMAEEASRWGDAPEAELFADGGATQRALGGYAPSARILVVDDSRDRLQGPQLPGRCLGLRAGGLSRGPCRPLRFGQPRPLQRLRRVASHRGEERLLARAQPARPGPGDRQHPGHLAAGDQRNRQARARVRGRPRISQMRELPVQDIRVTEERRLAGVPGPHCRAVQAGSELPPLPGYLRRHAAKVHKPQRAQGQACLDERGHARTHRPPQRHRQRLRHLGHRGRLRQRRRQCRQLASPLSRLLGRRITDQARALERIPRQHYRAEIDQHLVPVLVPELGADRSVRTRPRQFRRATWPGAASQPSRPAARSASSYPSSRRKAPFALVTRSVVAVATAISPDSARQRIAASAPAGSLPSPSAAGCPATTCHPTSAPGIKRNALEILN